MEPRVSERCYSPAPLAALARASTRECPPRLSGSGVPQESEVERHEHQHDAGVGHEPLPEVVLGTRGRRQRQSRLPSLPRRAGSRLAWPRERRYRSGVVPMREPPVSLDRRKRRSPQTACAVHGLRHNDSLTSAEGSQAVCAQERAVLRLAALSLKKAVPDRPRAAARSGTVDEDVQAQICPSAAVPALHGTRFYRGLTPELRALSSSTRSPAT